MNTELNSMRKLLERMDDATARMDQVICIAGAIGTGTIPDQLREIFEYEDEKYLGKIFGELPHWLLDALDGKRYEWEDVFIEWAVGTGHLGFMILFATPVMKHHGRSSSYSWGYYNTKWVYADTFDAAVDAGLAWVEERRKAEKVKEEATQTEAEKS